MLSSPFSVISVIVWIGLLFALLYSDRAIGIYVMMIVDMGCMAFATGYDFIATTPSIIQAVQIFILIIAVLFVWHMNNDDQVVMAKWKNYTIIGTACIVPFLVGYWVS